MDTVVIQQGFAHPHDARDLGNNAAQRTCEQRVLQLVSCVGAAKIAAGVRDPELPP